jgi:hypothetical protein
MSERELQRAVESCVESLVSLGRGHLAQRVGTRVERLLREGRESQALAVIALFRPTTP